MAGGAAPWWPDAKNIQTDRQTARAPCTCTCVTYTYTCVPPPAAASAAAEPRARATQPARSSQSLIGLACAQWLATSEGTDWHTAASAAPEHSLTLPWMI